MKCEICKKDIKKTYLDKIVGTVIYKKGKMYYICNSCQRKIDKKEIKFEA
ncbi:MAG: hypothetical protein QXR30_00280 [Candidatus Woesearchaeota archaeon]